MKKLTNEEFWKRFGDRARETLKAISTKYCERCEGITPEQVMVVVKEEFKPRPEGDYPKVMDCIKGTKITTYQCGRCGAKEVDRCWLFGPKHEDLRLSC